jgi:hypothetical protein
MAVNTRCVDLEHGQDKHSHLGVCPPYAAIGLDTVDNRQLNIHQHDVRLQLLSQRD